MKIRPAIHPLTLAAVAVLILCEFAHPLSWTFFPDSLKGRDKGFILDYPGISKININPHFSLPLKTIYLETAAQLEKSAFHVKTEDQVIIGNISEELSQFQNKPTGNPGDIFATAYKYTLDITTPILDLQEINIDKVKIYAVSILPVILDRHGRLVFNCRVSLVIDSAGAAVVTLDDADVKTRFPIQKHNGPTYAPKALSPGCPLGIEYLIITNDYLAPAFRKLALFKKAVGTPASIAVTDSIYTHYAGLDPPEKIRRYLSDFFNTGGRYVLLGGDQTIIPVRYVHYYNVNSYPPDSGFLMPSDLYYADLSGDWDFDGDGIWGEPTHDRPDLSPELIVGRLPISSPLAAENYVEKAIRYAVDPGDGDPDYLTRSFFFCSDEMRDFPENGQHGAIASALPDYITVDTTFGVEIPSGRHPDPLNPPGAACIDKISEGYGLVNIIAHGHIGGFVVKSTDYCQWPASYIFSSYESGDHGCITDLAANNRTSLYYSLSCHMGAFDLDSTDGASTNESFVEKIMAAPASGAVGAVANSRWGWVYSSYLLQKSFIENLYGPAGGNPAVAMYYSWLPYHYYRDLIYGQNFFGDPDLQIHLDTPRKMNLSITLNNDEYAVNVTEGGYGLDGVLISVVCDNEIIESGLTDEAGVYRLSSLTAIDKEYTIYASLDEYLVTCCSFVPSLVLSFDDNESEALPESFALAQNHPNPFNHFTTIQYNIPYDAFIRLEIIDLLGRVVRILKTGNQNPGKYTVAWDGADNNRHPVATGIYFARLQAGDFMSVKKMLLLK